MVSLSKLLDQGLRDAKCNEVFHPGITCCQYCFGSTYSYLITCIKYFLPVAIIPLLMKGRQMQKEHLWDALRHYTEAVITGFFTSQTVPIAICGTRALCRRYNRYNFIYIPSLFVPWTVFCTSDRIARLFASSLFQVHLHAVIRNARNPVSRTIGQSKLLQTLMFMTCSAFVLHTVQNYGVKIFWIVKSVPRQYESNKCGHRGSCSKFCSMELSKALMIGVLFDLFKIISGGVPKGSSFASIIKKKLLSLAFPTTFFLSSYTGVYRLTSCLLNRTWKTNPQLKHIVAAFLAGVPFYFLPKLAMLYYGVTICIEISWGLFKRHKFKNNNQFVETIKKIPFHGFYAAVATAYLVHMYVFRIHLINSMGVAIVAGLTGNNDRIFKNNVYNYFKSIDK